MSRILLKLRPGKPTEVKVEGVPGNQCHAVSAPFEALMGKKISSVPTPEAQLPARESLGVSANQSLSQE